MSGWDDLFRDPPPRWGLRGDPHLWVEMRAALGEAPVPDNRDDGLAMLTTAWEALAGLPLSSSGTIKLSRLDHGGMSGGLVSAPFWRHVAIPLLLDRLVNLPH